MVKRAFSESTETCWNHKMPLLKYNYANLYSLGGKSMSQLLLVQSLRCYALLYFLFFHFFKNFINKGYENADFFNCLFRQKSEIFWQLKERNKQKPKSHQKVWRGGKGERNAIKYPIFKSYVCGNHSHILFFFFLALSQHVNNLTDRNISFFYMYVSNHDNYI